MHVTRRSCSESRFQSIGVYESLPPPPPLASSLADASVPGPCPQVAQVSEVLELCFPRSSASVGVRNVPGTGTMIAAVLNGCILEGPGWQAGCLSYPFTQRAEIRQASSGDVTLAARRTFERDFLRKYDWQAGEATASAGVILCELE